MDNVPQSHAIPERQHSRSRWALIGFLAVAAFFLFSEHRAHFLGILPYLLVLACPLMHFFTMDIMVTRTVVAPPPETGAPSEASANPGEKS